MHELEINVTDLVNKLIHVYGWDVELTKKCFKTFIQKFITSTNDDTMFGMKEESNVDIVNFEGFYFFKVQVNNLKPKEWFEDLFSDY